MGREPSPMVSTAGLASAAVGEAYIDAVVPPGLAEADHARASEGATAFFNILLRHVAGDPEAMPQAEAMLRSVATEVVEQGDDAGVLLDRFDAGRHVLIQAILESDMPREMAAVADDRLRIAQSAARTAIRDATVAYDSIIDNAVGQVTRAVEGGAAP